MFTRRRREKRTDACWLRKVWPKCKNQLKLITACTDVSIFNILAMWLNASVESDTFATNNRINQTNFSHTYASPVIRFLRLKELIAA